MKILGIDPGQKGALVLLQHGKQVLVQADMPLEDSKDADFDGLMSLFKSLEPDVVYLERAMPMAMGSKHAFNYGRHFACIEIAIRQSRLPVVYVEPSKWMRVVLEGVDSRLKPKERSWIALQRLMPTFAEKVPKGRTGRPHDGVVDACLIALYGFMRVGQGHATQAPVPDSASPA